MWAGRDPNLTGSTATTAVRRGTFSRSAGNPTARGKARTTGIKARKCWKPHSKGKGKNSRDKGKEETDPSKGNVTGGRTTPLREKMAERARSGVINSSVRKGTAYNDADCYQQGAPRPEKGKTIIATAQAPSSQFTGGGGRGGGSVYDSAQRSTHGRARQRLHQLRHGLRPVQRSTWWTTS